MKSGCMSERLYNSVLGTRDQFGFELLCQTKLFALTGEGSKQKY